MTVRARADQDVGVRAQLLVGRRQMVEVGPRADGREEERATRRYAEMAILKLDADAPGAVAAVVLRRNRQGNGRADETARGDTQAQTVARRRHEAARRSNKYFVAGERRVLAPATPLAWRAPKACAERPAPSFVSSAEIGRRRRGAAASFDGRRARAAILAAQATFAAPFGVFFLGLKAVSKSMRAVRVQLTANIALL